MEIIVYKGFDTLFLENLDAVPLLNNGIHEKSNVMNYDKKQVKSLKAAFIGLEDCDQVWVTYEEYTVLRGLIDDAMDSDDIAVRFVKNNLFPDCYPLNFNLNASVAEEIMQITEGNSDKEDSDMSVECANYLKFFNTLLAIDGTYFGSFYNYEYDLENVIVENYYDTTKILDYKDSNDFTIFINDDVETYLRDLSRLKKENPAVIGVKTTKGDAAKRILNSLAAYCKEKEIELTYYNELLEGVAGLESELAEIAKNDIGIKGFSSFRNIKFYKNPDINNEVVEISQAKIIQDIIQQAENSYDETKAKSFRDIFITASTGAGKSVMFQIPAVYLAKKYNKLTIIIEPVKALMQDQKEKLISNGYTRVEAFNSDLITQVEKEQVLKRIKAGEVDLLYLSPETLLSYSIETIIGDREIGLLIVDEAHIVTTWGFGFRPDYWYLGGYINRLRNQIQTTRGVKRKVYDFPICAFTATAINGGKDDSVSDTIVSLYMENPIKYIGYVKRDDIHFDITCFNNEKMKKAEYEKRKKEKLEQRINSWTEKNEKTIVYFPYASYASSAKKGIGPFSGMSIEKEKVGLYTGKNTDELGQEAFNAKKREVFEGFRTGKLPVVMATKAFGMGIDVDDVSNVYHYAVTGNLSDYIQEIGRAARRQEMVGYAITDYYFNDLSFMNALFGMSQIKQHQIKKVLEEIYNTHKNKNYARSFLITPQSFSYIFNDKEVEKSTNKLKTCLLMLEKDFYDKYNFKVIISRPQSVFTKAFVCVDEKYEEKVINSKYGPFFTYICPGRDHEKRSEYGTVSDVGNIYSIDLKTIWEKYHPDISFPQFKYWFFNANSNDPNKVKVMPTIRRYIYPRQKITIEAREDHTVSEVRDLLLADFEIIADTLYSKFRNQYFSSTELVHVLSPLFGRRKANIISDSLFDIVDPDHSCVKSRINEATGKWDYTISNGTLKELMRRSVVSSPLVKEKMAYSNEKTWTGFESLTSASTEKALKLFSVFDYISYEVVGGEDPEIFIRLNDPNKVKDIVYGNLHYSNNYVSKAKEKHDRDVQVLLKFFTELHSDKERWDYIENYFLGYDVLSSSTGSAPSTSTRVTLEVDKDHSYSTSNLDGWADICVLFEDEDQPIISHLEQLGIALPEYLETSMKNSDLGNDIVMSWPSNRIAIFNSETPESTMKMFEAQGWKTFNINSVDYGYLKEVIV